MVRHFTEHGENPLHTDTVRARPIRMTGLATRLGRAARIALLCSAVSWRLAAQVPAPAGAAEVAPGAYLIADRTNSLLVMRGKTETVVVGMPARPLIARAEQLVKALGAPPIKYVVVIAGDSMLQRGTGEWHGGNPTIISHENIRLPMRFPPDTIKVPGRLPEVGFSEVLQLFTADDEMHFVHQPSGFSDADISVHFEERKFLYLGNLFTSDGYPAIARGGSLSGLITSASKFMIQFGSRPELIEPIIPGRGPVATLAGLAEFRDMLAAVHDRIEPMVRAGKTLDDVLASKPTADFDARWGHGPVTADQFVAMAHKSIVRELRAQAKPPAPLD
jgi:cyclase